jgi:predicted nucleic acid-binding protein
LQTRRYLREGKDKGEAEAVIQAAQRAAQMVLTDDWLGREWAEKHARECHGAIWICYELRRRGFLDELRRYFVRMLDLGRWLPLAGMNGYKKRVGRQRFIVAAARKTKRNKTTVRALRAQRVGHPPGNPTD